MADSNPKKHPIFSEIMAQLYGSDIKLVCFVPTPYGLAGGAAISARQDLRDWLTEEGIHDYSAQPRTGARGPDAVLKPINIVNGKRRREAKIHFYYPPNSEQRFWILDKTEAKGVQWAKGGDLVALAILEDRSLGLVNLSRGTSLKELIASRALLVTEPSEHGNSSSGFSDIWNYPDFRPKSHEEYVVQMTGGTQIKSRDHERLVNDFANHAKSVGFAVAGGHPRDLVLSDDENTWLIEAKVVRKGDVTSAVRGAIGQLFDYRHNFHRDEAVLLAGLFTEPLGDVYLGLLDSLGIHAIWQELGGRWITSDPEAASALGIRASQD